MKQHKLSYEQIIQTIITSHFDQAPKFIRHITIGTINEVYAVGLDGKEVIVRLSPVDKFLMGSHDHIPQFKTLGIPVPDILFEDYSKTVVPFSYQIQSKIEGQDLGLVIEILTDEQLKELANEIALIFNKLKTIPTNNIFGIIWGGGDNEVSDTWTERMRIWLDESIERGRKTGVMNDNMTTLVENIFTHYKPYFDSVKAVTYCGDINYKNVMIYNGAFSGLVDLDGLTQGDPLEAIGRIKLSWYGTHYGNVYTNALIDEMKLNAEQKKLVTLYALINQISWTCANGIQFNQNTKAVVDRVKEKIDKEIIQALVAELEQKGAYL